MEKMKVCIMKNAENVVFWRSFIMLKNSSPRLYTRIIETPRDEHIIMYKKSIIHSNIQIAFMETKTIDLRLEN